MLDEWERLEDAASPLGATWIAEEQPYNFAIYSKHVDEVTLQLYGEHDFAASLYSIPFELPRNKTNRVWHVRVPAATSEGGRYYGYRIAGPFDPSQGQGFDDQKILLAMRIRLQCIASYPAWRSAIIRRRVWAPIGAING
jgi:glycogen operon protein